jgi:hypothetical protein
MEELIQRYFGEWGAWVITGLLILAARDAISQTWSGLKFMMGNDFNNDDIVYINGTKKARIVRQGIYKTTFYLYDHQRKFIVPNDRLWSLNIEKEIPQGRDEKN